MAKEFEFLNGIGKNAELILEGYLKQSGFEVENVSEVKEYQRIDVDYLATKQGQTIKVEIKNDSKISKYNNFFFEESHLRIGGYRDGWLSYCQADVLCFLDSVKGILYLLDWKKLKPFVLKNGQSREFHNKSDNCPSRGLILPVAVVRNQGFIIREIKLS